MLPAGQHTSGFAIQACGNLLAIIISPLWGSSFLYPYGFHDLGNKITVVHFRAVEPALFANLAFEDLEGKGFGLSQRDFNYLSNGFLILKQFSLSNTSIGATKVVLLLSVLCCSYFIPHNSLPTIRNS